MLTESEVIKIIEANPKVVVKVWDDGCPFCKEYDPIFDTAASLFPDYVFVSLKIPRKDESAFRAAYMLENGKVKNSVPATIIFEGGEFKAVAWGRMYIEALSAFINTGAVQKPKPPTPEEFVKKASLMELEASLWQVSNQINIQQNTFNIFKAEWDRRLESKQ
jgi:thiol-disulfide isomerase/thioredoxin